MYNLQIRYSLRLLTATCLVLATGAVADDILRTNGFTNCDSNPTITVERVDINYNKDNRSVTFDILGSSSKPQNVSAYLDVTAYGNSIYTNSFNPCDEGTFVSRLCPVPEGPFEAWGEQQIPSQFADLVPGIAFQIPDIAAKATLRLKSLETDENVACIQSQVTNGKTADVPAVSYVAAGIAGAALLASGATAVGSALAGGAVSGGGGAGTVSPSFFEVMGWFQGLAMNGMFSVNYPPVYRSFTKNFAFSTGLIPWEPLQSRIDQFRSVTGGNLTNDSVEFLRNATLLFPGGSAKAPDQQKLRVKRAFDDLTILASRQLGFDAPDPTGGEGVQATVSGIQAFANQLRVPGSDVFMTILLIVAIAIASIVVFVLLFKLILEAWAIWGNFPASLAGFRRHYWGSIARTITTLIFLLYGIWVLYCVFQFTRGDSWAATTLAAVTLAIFTGILAFFAYKIWSTARKLKATQGDTNDLYDEKKIWVKYSLFYDSYRKQYWWLFVPVMIYMAVKGCVLAATDGSGRVQTIAVLIVEAVMLALLVWSRPYERKSGNVINIIIQTVRFLSVACILVFVEEFGIRQTTQTVTGVVLIAVQSTLTVVLVVLIAWHGIEACCRENPHRRRRKDLEKKKMMLQEGDDLTPLDARNSLLLDRVDTSGKMSAMSMRSSNSLGNDPVRPVSVDRYEDVTYRPPVAPSGGPMFRPMTPTTENDLQNNQMAGFGRQPTLPIVNPYSGTYGYRG